MLTNIILNLSRIFVYYYNTLDVDVDTEINDIKCGETLRASADVKSKLTVSCSNNLPKISTSYFSLVPNSSWGLGNFAYQIQ